MKDITFCCPQCETPLNVRPATTLGGTVMPPVRRGIQTMHMGDSLPVNNNQSVNFKTLSRPVHELKIEHFLMSGFVGFCCSSGAVIITGLMCEFGSTCIDTTNMILIGAGAGIVGFIATLGFINRGRYEHREEPIQAPQPAPVIKKVAPKQQIRVEIVEKTSTSSTNHQWFDLPTCISKDDMKRLARALKDGDGRFSLPYLVRQKKALTDHKYRALVAVLKERNLLHVHKKKSYVSAAGYKFIYTYLDPDVDEKHVNEGEEGYTPLTANEAELFRNGAH